MNDQENVVIDIDQLPQYTQVGFEEMVDEFVEKQVH